jgi:hypothetical protein
MDTTYWQAVNETNPIERVAEDLDFDIYLRLRAINTRNEYEDMALICEDINDIEQSEREW